MLALLWREDGWERVGDIEQRVASTVNLAEVASVLAKIGHTVGEIRALLASLGLLAVDFDEAQAIEVARLRPLTVASGLSLGDRACLALAGIRQLPALTADRAWEGAVSHVAIEFIR